MPVSKSNSVQRWLLNTFIVVVMFLIVDLGFHFFWPTDIPYMDGFLEKVVYTTLFAAVFAHLYDKSSQEFCLINAVQNGKVSVGSKVLNGFVFSILCCLVIFMAVGLMLWLGSTIYMYVLDGFHGAPPPPDTRSTVLIGTQVVVAGGTVSAVGKTEDNPR